jgi:co-chaperonin GroES (HSP10)
MSDYHNAYLPHLHTDLQDVEPLGHKLLVRVEEKPGVTNSGIHLAGYTPSDRGVVVAVGDKVTEVQPGDRVLYLWRKGDDFVVDGSHWLFLEEEHLLAVISGAEGPCW